MEKEVQSIGLTLWKISWMHANCTKMECLYEASIFRFIRQQASSPRNGVKVNIKHLYCQINSSIAYVFYDLI